MSVTPVSRIGFSNWVRNSTNRRPSVLMVKTNECAPCKRVFPDFVKIADKYADFMQFGYYNLYVADKEWIAEFLEVKSTPTFLVVNADEDIIFRVTSAKRIDELHDYLSHLV